MPNMKSNDAVSAEFLAKFGSNKQASGTKNAANSSSKNEAAAGSSADNNQSSSAGASKEPRTIDDLKIDTDDPAI